ncbi:unnamed protein product [Calypogeia fissa]
MTNDSLTSPLLTTEDVLDWGYKGPQANMGSFNRLPSKGRKNVLESELAQTVPAYMNADELLLAETPSPRWQLCVPHVLVATMASILFGYHLGVVNIPLAAIAHDLELTGSTMAQGSVVSACLVGAFAGCSISGMVAERYGRCRSFQLSTMPMIMGSILSATAPNFWIMVAGRLLVGIGLGVAGPVASLYISEISPTNVRGTMGSLVQVATCLGILGAIVAALPVRSIPGWWRVCFWIATIPAGLLALFMEFCAESPRWLFEKSRWAEAEREFERLWGFAHAKGAMADLTRGEDELGEAPWSSLWNKRYRKAVFIGSALFGLQQLSGINAVFYFSSVVFKHAGVQSEVAASVYMGIVNLAASGLAAFLVDKKGRRYLLLWSFSGMAVAMAMQAAAAGLKVLAPMQGHLSLLATLSYVFMFAVGAGPVPALLLPEIFASRIRAKAMSVAMCVHWIVNFVVGLFFLQLLQQLGASTLYACFSIVCLMATVFVMKNVQETKGRPLEDIK